MRICDSSLDASFKAYQTFDELKMSGIGKSYKSPFVFVKETSDTIIVRSSDPKDSCRIYVKLKEGLWYSHMSYELWKRKGYVALKEPWERFARTYDRYFYNDTIYEYYKSFYDGRMSPTIYIKTKCNVVVLKFQHGCNSMNLPTIEVRRDLYKKLKNIPVGKGYIHISEMRVRYNKYLLCEGKYKIRYCYNNSTSDFEFHNKSYGLWGIQPGVDERRLVNGQDIDNFSGTHPYGLNVPDMVYDIVDEMPSYPGGTLALRKYIRDETKKITNIKRKEKVVVSFVVYEDGCIDDVKIISTTTSDNLINERAKEIIGSMPKWNSGRQNGKCVKVRYMFPVTFVP